MPSSANVPWSIRRSIRSRAMSFSCACWRAIRSSPPPSLALARRSCRSSTSGRRIDRGLVVLLDKVRSETYRFLRGLVQAHGPADEVHERLLIDLVVLVEVDRPAGVALEARVEQPRRIIQRRPLEERELHHALVRLARADDAFVRPHRDAGVRG